MSKGYEEIVEGDLAAANYYVAAGFKLLSTAYGKKGFRYSLGRPDGVNPVPMPPAKAQAPQDSTVLGASAVSVPLSVVRGLGDRGKEKKG